MARSPLVVGMGGTAHPVDQPHGTVCDQVTYAGSPLYRYTADHQPAGTGAVGLLWHVINPQNAPEQTGTTG